jgi:hypothetical protein
MVGVEYEGSRATVEAVAAGRDDQLGVAGLGFGASGHASREGVPDPKLVELAKRRTLTAEDKAADPRRGRRVHPVLRAGGQQAPTQKQSRHGACRARTCAIAQPRPA